MNQLLFAADTMCGNTVHIGSSTSTHYVYTNTHDTHMYSTHKYTHNTHYVHTNTQTTHTHTGTHKYTHTTRSTGTQTNYRAIPYQMHIFSVITLPNVGQMQFQPKSTTVFTRKVEHGLRLDQILRTSKHDLNEFRCTYLLASCNRT